MADDLFEKIKEIIVEQLGVDPEKVVMEARFQEDLEADSLDLVELIMAFEDEFGGEISDDEVERAKLYLLNLQEQALANSSRLAVSLSTWAGQGDWRLFFLHRDNLESVTPESVRAVAASSML